ncbi:hypothetical protein ACWC5G_36290, partial [Streptomyces sp. NPDC001274]
QHLCTLAATDYALHTLRARAAVTNTPSRTVLTRTGFTPTGETLHLDGRPALAYVREDREGRLDRRPVCGAGRRSSDGHPQL